ncbi:MAG: tyrosine-type recombinase/integrase [Acidimicrobiales bacterium]
MKRRTFGSIRRLPSGRWQARYRDWDGGMRTAGESFETKADADRWLATLRHEVATGEWVDPKLGELTVGEWATAWMRNQLHLKPKTKASYQSLLTSRLLPSLGSFPIGELRTSHVQAMLTRFQQEGLSASRCRQVVMVLSQVLDAAIADGIIRANACGAVRLPRLPKTEMEVLSAGEVERLAGSIDPRYRSLVHVLAYGGLRWGEVVALTRYAVDLQRGRLDVFRSVAEAGGHLHVGPTKTYQQRSVVLPTFLRADLEAHLIQHVEPWPDAVLFPAPSGGYLRYGNFVARYWRPALEKAGLEPIGLHVMRHTCASLLAAAGAPIKAIQAQLGHSTAEMTLNRYSHLYPDDLDALATHLDAVRRRADLSRRLRAPGGEGGRSRGR